MNNPNSTDPTPMDIRAEADRVVDLLAQGRIDEGIDLLDETRRNERLVVQEALDRYVLAGSRDVISQPSLYQHASADVAPTILRLHAAGLPPRMPAHGLREGETNEFLGLTAAQEYDVYASIAAVRGTNVVADELARNNNGVILGLRRETPSWASGNGDGRAGTGVYDDRIVVLLRGANGERSVFAAHRASTEPTAQYDHHARLVGDAANPVYQGVTRHRPIQGQDVDGDGVRDLGRMADGTFELEIALHNNPASAGTDAALRPSRRAMDAGLGVGLIQRDTNGDGFFNGNDPNGVQDLNPTFKIHSGSRQNTDSAGCQTIHPDDYLGFINAVQTNQDQDFFKYVLASTHDGAVRDLDTRRDASPDDVGLPEAREQPGNHRGPVPAVRGANDPLDGREVQRVEPGGNRQGHVPATPGPFDDPGLNRYYAAIMGGDAALADRIALGFGTRFPEPDLQHLGDSRAGVDDATTQREQAARSHVPGLHG